MINGTILSRVRESHTGCRFISYSRQNIAFAERLFAALQNRQVSAWVDWQNIPRSAGWWDEIKRGIDAASTFIFIMSNDSVGSVVCTLELAHAIENGKRVIPVMIETVNFEQAFGRLAAVQPDDVLGQILVGRDPLQVARTNRGVIGHINWVFFGQNPQGQDIPFAESIDELLDTVNTDLEHNRRHARLQVRAREWENGQRADDLLLIGEEITQAESWLADATVKGKAPRPTALQTNYITTSRTVEDARLRRLRNIRRASLVASLVAGVAVILAVAASVVGVQARFAGRTVAARKPPRRNSTDTDVAYEQMEQPS
ncbi:MAG: toll/interleukin-1 receptor domain-containing protein [Anaerolineaceae bacterium]|nr:toll/interleukin-1 receptor domain-containing protein [Anaerolineaceae bacterium]